MDFNRKNTYSSAQSSIGPMYYEEFLDLASPPRAIISRKYAQYSVIIVNTDGAAAYSTLSSLLAAQIATKGSHLPISETFTRVSYMIWGAYEITK